MSGRTMLPVRRAWPLRALYLARTGHLALAIWSGIFHPEVRCRGDISTKPKKVSTMYGQAGRGIVDAAHAHDAGIIVMGSRGHSGMTGLVLGSGNVFVGDHTLM